MGRSRNIFLSLIQGFTYQPQMIQSDSRALLAITFFTTMDDTAMNPEEMAGTPAPVQEDATEATPTETAPETEAAPETATEEIPSADAPTA